MASSKTTSSIYDYPEHLNPFRDDDNHSRMRFWTIGRKKPRSSSFSFNSSFKDLRNTLTLRSFRKKEGRELTSPKSPTSCISAQNSPVEYRKPYNGVVTLNRQSSTSQPQFDTLCTPLPRSRFHERVSHLENKVESPTEKIERVSLSFSPTSPTSHRDGRPFALPGLTETKADRGSYTSLISNPFDDTANSSIRASTRKKRRAPLPPIPNTSTPVSTTVPNITITDTSLTTNNTSTSVRRKLLDDMESSKKDDIDIDDPSFKTELKIIEDKDEVEVQENLKDKDELIIKEEVVTPEKQCEEVDMGIIKEENEFEKFEKSIAVEGNCVLEITTSKIEVTQTKTIDDSSLYANSEDVKVVSKVNSTESKPFTLDPLEDDVFKKVDIATYKKQQTLEYEPEESNNKVDDNSNNISNANTEESRIFECGTTVNNIETVNHSLETQKELNDNSNGISKTEKYQPRIISCAIFGDKVETVRHDVNRNDWEMTEFREFDKVIRDIESSAIAYIDEDESATKPDQKEPKSRRVSDMKTYFDNFNDMDRKSFLEVEANSPNPIPKPRRSKVYSQSTSIDSTQTPSTPTSLIK